MSQEIIKVLSAALHMVLKVCQILRSFLSMRLAYKKLELMWLKTEETLQAATTFIIYHKNKNTRLQIILCKLEIFCFPFIKKWLVILCTFTINISTLSCMLCMISEMVGGGEKCIV